MKSLNNKNILLLIAALSCAPVALVAADADVAAQLNTAKLAANAASRDARRDPQAYAEALFAVLTWSDVANVGPRDASARLAYVKLFKTEARDHIQEDCYANLLSPEQQARLIGEGDLAKYAPVADEEVEPTTTTATTVRTWNDTAWTAGKGLGFTTAAAGTGVASVYLGAAFNDALASGNAAIVAAEEARVELEAGVKDAQDASAAAQENFERMQGLAELATSQVVADSEQFKAAADLATKTAANLDAATAALADSGPSLSRGQRLAQTVHGLTGGYVDGSAAAALKADPRGVVTGVASSAKNTVVNAGYTAGSTVRDRVFAIPGAASNAGSSVVAGVAALPGATYNGVLALPGKTRNGVVAIPGAAKALAAATLVLGKAQVARALRNPKKAALILALGAYLAKKGWNNRADLKAKVAATKSALATDVAWAYDYVPFNTHISSAAATAAEWGVWGFSYVPGSGYVLGGDDTADADADAAGTGDSL